MSEIQKKDGLYENLYTIMIGFFISFYFSIFSMGRRGKPVWETALGIL